MFPLLTDGVLSALRVKLMKKEQAKDQQNLPLRSASGHMFASQHSSVTRTGQSPRALWGS